MESVVDTVASDLKKISAGESLADKEKNDLKKRKLIAETYFYFFNNKWYPQILEQWKVSSSVKD